MKEKRRRRGLGSSDLVAVIQTYWIYSLLLTSDNLEESKFSNFKCLVSDTKPLYKYSAIYEIVDYLTIVWATNYSDEKNCCTDVMMLVELRS